MARRSTARALTLADRADRFALYQAAVNNPDDDLEFIERVYTEARGRAPQILKEDFCGTALLAATWAARGPRRRAIGVDLDDDALAWAARHNLSPETADRVALIHADVLAASRQRADVVCALNFSWFLLHDRPRLVAYLRNARRALRPGGLMFLDCVGGTEAYGDHAEERDLGEFRYLWRQRGFNPLDHTARCTIGFAFPDGSRLDPAFDYRWRAWTLPELRDCLAEAGFASVRVFWDDGEAWRETDHERNQEVWLVYVVAGT